MCPWSANSKMGSGNFIRRRSTKAGISFVASPGRRSPRTRRNGNRRSRSTAARAGRPTGSIRSSACKVDEMQIENDGRNDFDFLIGAWKVHHRTLKKRLNESTEWNEFEGETLSSKILNGLGIMDHSILHAQTGPVHALALRLFNPASKEWSIYWATDRTGILDVPVIGS